jgi:TolB-like protein
MAVVRIGRFRAKARLLIIASALLGLALGLTAAPAQAGENPKLLVLPIVVHSAEDPEYLRNGLADMLNARFSRIGALDLLRPSDPGQGTTQLEKALALGRKAGADFVLYGSFTRFGQGASLDVQCAPTDETKMREPLREIFVHSGSIGEIIPDLDELAGKVSRFANGELVSSPGPASAGYAGDEASREDLIRRIEALEDGLAELLESSDDEAREELR